MTDKLKQKMNEELIKLPKEKQEAISSIDWDNITKDIGKKFLLSEDEINDLQLETGLVLLGFVNLDLYILNIEQIGLSKSEAKDIVLNIFEKVLSPISDKFNEIIKRAGIDKIASWKQNIGFIISGGDYSVFLEETKVITE